MNNESLGGSFHRLDSAQRVGTALGGSFHRLESELIAQKRSPQSSKRVARQFAVKSRQVGVAGLTSLNKEDYGEGKYCVLVAVPRQ
jgi:hypothetical protein